MNFGLVNASHSLPEWQAVADKTEQVLTSPWGEESSLVREEQVTAMTAMAQQDLRGFASAC